VATAAKKTIEERLVEVMKELDGFKPEGKNKHFSYDYWTADQLANIFRPLFVKHELAFMADVESYELIPKGKGFITTLIVRFTISCPGTDEEMSGRGIGQGDDNTDKGANKAMSGALKYWLLKTFLLGGEDAENDALEKAARVKVEDSDIEGIEKGGRPTTTTDVQVTRFRQLARDLELDATASGELLADILGAGPDLKQTASGDAGPELIKYVSRLKSEDMGKVIQYMEKMVDDA